MRRTLVLVVVALSWLVFAPAAGGDANDLEPTATGWWQVGPLALVTSAGMDDGELLVEGIGDDATQQAVAALAFAAPDNDTPVELRVPVVTATPSDATFKVCTVTEPFEPVDGGPAEDVPAHDCSGAVAAELAGDGQTLAVVLDVGTAGEDVRVLLVPDGPGRIVLDGDGSRLRLGPATTTPPDPDGASTPSPPAGPTPPGPGARTTLGAPRTAPALPAEPVAAPSTDPTLPPSADTEARSPLAAPVAGYHPPASDASARAVTAAFIAIALGTFTALNRGGTSRLRPATVPWLSPDE